MVVDIEFDSITLPTTKIKRTYNIPSLQSELIKSIRQLFDSSKHGVHIIPVKITILDEDECKEITLIVTTTCDSSSCKVINPRIKDNVVIEPFVEKKLSLAERFVRWLKAE